MLELLDAVADRANFTWRNSFAVTEVPKSYNMTWTELLLWSIENYDISIHAWDHTAERMAQGVTYTEPWHDSSLVLVDRRRSIKDAGIDPLNWTKPFEPAVWGMILLTILLSALAYQQIEYLSGERGERSLCQWFSDNLYLSAINFSQNFEYAPNTFAGRIFGVSMTLWALVITATYTANLASLFVESKVEPILVDSMEQAVVYGYPVCTKDNTNADFFIRQTFPKVHRVPRMDYKACIQSVSNGECALGLIPLDSWLTYKVNDDYNPNCDLDWVGDMVKEIKAGFAVTADAGHKCSSLVRNVVNVHLKALVDDGLLEELWQKYRDLADDGTCAYNDDDNGQANSNRRLQSQRTLQAMAQSGRSVPSTHRMMRGGGKPSGGGTDGVDSDTLTLEQMAGTFFLHWVAMVVAIVVSYIRSYFPKLHCCDQKGHVAEKVTNRTNGPIIGSPPPVNTYVVRNIKEQALDISHESGTHNRLESESCYDVAHAEIVAEMNAMRRALDVQTKVMQQFLEAPHKEQFV
ncbi:PBPe [Seminavis robusta]|uniref:PBPe n=1 Tax=Seminavis robusta TaxID=568900 RepID=A0A9N8EV73_9STRA|nr:PBPe [Seminavis robusta]|eukprot:Sro1777_g296920.1 PBPe (520) ;mRNA; f:5801-7360